jgi:hypothetical protein
VEGQRFNVQGTITLSAGCQLIGAEVSGGGSIVDSGGLNSNVRIINCKVTTGNIYSYFNDGKTWVDNDSVLNGAIRIYNGRVSGCYVHGEIQLLSGAPSSNDTVAIVGNHAAISCASTTVYSYVANNFVTLTGAPFGQPNIGILISGAKSDASIKNVVFNNTVNKAGPGASNAYKFSQASGALIEIHNNIATKEASAYSSAIGFVGNNQSGMNFTYNYDHSSTTAFSNLPTDPTNISGSTTTVDSNTGILVAGSDAINGGDPGTAYLDLDLTRNDAGCYGGSYSRENFTQTDMGSRVVFMKAPREVLQGQPVNVSGEGVDK